MAIIKLVVGAIVILYLDLAVAVNNYDGIPRVPYCGALPHGCCRGREDSCSTPIIGTYCYCDEFCDRDHNEDCCPDFKPVCRGEPSPPETLYEKTCNYKGQTVTYKSSIKDNCRTCTCVKIDEDNVKMECEMRTCIIEENMLNAVNELINTYGWRGRNYTEYWGKGLDEGLKLRLGTLQPDRFVRRMIPVKKIYDPYSLPQHFDADEKWRGSLSYIQNQGWCGSSWAISTAAVASDRFAIVSQGLERVQLSPQNLLSCNNRGQQSCSGGYLDKAWLFLRKYGLVNEACFPYTGYEESCRIPKLGNLLEAGCVPPRNVDRKEKYKTGPAYRIGNETDIMNEIIESGPVQATMKVYHDFFLYEAGIYRHTDLSIEDRTGYHSVRIVGWGQETDYTGRTHKYWKVANSWGHQWGENGYFRIARGVNECEIESFVLAAWPLTIDPVSKNDVYGV